jgi:UDPglucose 6-dehydrogenase
MDKEAILTVYDPEAMVKARKILGSQVKYAKTAKASLRNAHCCIIGTDWEEFRRIKPRDFRALMTSPLVVDGRRIYSPDSFEGEDVVYVRIGSANRLQKDGA